MDVLKDKPVRLDLEAAIANIKRKGTPNRVYCFEHGLEPGIKQSLCDRFEFCKGLDENNKHFLLQREIRIQKFLGQEFLRVFPGGMLWQGLVLRMAGENPD